MSMCNNSKCPTRWECEKYRRMLRDAGEGLDKSMIYTYTPHDGYCNGFKALPPGYKQMNSIVTQKKDTTKRRGEKAAKAGRLF